jgi:hypothetical protein
MKNSDRFNKIFFTTATAQAGKGNQQTRDNDCGHYFQVAVYVQHHFHGKSMIEVGCGMGWITQHLKIRGENCIGFDIGKWATDNAVTEGIFHADLMDAVDWNKKWEVAVCSNVFAYFEREEVPVAIRGLKNIFTEYAVVTIQTKENVIKNWGEDAIKPPNPRKTFESWDWWKDQFEKEGLVIGKKHDEIIANPGPHKLVPKDMGGRPTTFILEHAT